jgi:hypothetical protein
MEERERNKQGKAQKLMMTKGEKHQVKIQEQDAKRETSRGSKR